ncbi:Neuropeptide Y receptor type 2 [Collichthys lucidus]|uniref:Neuropeptide Y receptor type 2 n=1 Tax=Collichthys lucidus TaxID=240159 RepID=A0A4U5TYG0_COLLU|nr:Neuropeptide Y receptor type 2 [Collichthys lucidus]
MVVVFAVSWLPFHAFQLATDIDNTVLDMRDYRLLYTVFHVIAMCSTFANPLLYGWMNRNYRAAFLAVFKCRRGVRLALYDILRLSHFDTTALDLSDFSFYTRCDCAPLSHNAVHGFVVIIYSSIDMGRVVSDV